MLNPYGADAVRVTMPTGFSAMHIRLSELFGYSEMISGMRFVSRRYCEIGDA